MNIENKIMRSGIHCLVIDESNRILVLKRHSEDVKDPNCWDLPGGGISRGEDISLGLAREIIEETGVTVSDINLIGSYTCDEGRLQLCAIAKFKNGEVKISVEHSEYRWVNQDEFLALKPAGLHLKASQYFIAHNNKVVTFGELYRETTK